MQIECLKNRIHYLSFKQNENHLSPQNRFEYREKIKKDNLEKIKNADDKEMIFVRNNKNEIADLVLIGEEAENGYKYFVYDKEGIEAGRISLSYKEGEKIYVSSLKTDYKNYKGIGSKLIKTAVKKSFKEGQKGELFAHAFNSSCPDVIYYRKSYSPIPFYYRMGFRANNEGINLLIDLGIKDLEKINFYTGPQETFMHLDKKAAKKILKK